MRLSIQCREIHFPDFSLVSRLLIWITALLLVNAALQAQESVEDRFWYGLDPALVALYFPDDRGTAVGLESDLLFESIHILKRESSFARIERTGEVFVLGNRKGRMVEAEGTLRILRDGQELGLINSDGSVYSDGVMLGMVDSYGYLYDAAGEYRGAFSGESIWIDGWVWGAAQRLASERQMRAAAAFLFFFTELGELWL